MSLRAKNGKWEYRFLYQGERITKLTDLEATEENRSRVLKLEKKHRDAVLRGEQPARRLISRGFTKASEDFLEWCEAEHPEKPNTVKRIKTSLWSLREWFGNQNVASVRRSDIERYKMWRLKTHQVQPITLRHDLDALSKFFGFAIIMDLRADNPLQKVKKPSAEDAVRMHILTEEEEREYFRRCAGNPRFSRLADVARLILDQGPRPDEVYSLERAACDTEGGRIAILAGKSRAAKRVLKLTPECAMIVERRYRESAGSKWLFPSPRRAGHHITKLNNAHNAVCSDEGGTRPELQFVLYDLRHTFATRAAAEGMSVTALAAVLGHSSLRLVLRYVHVQQSIMDREMDMVAAAREVRLKAFEERLKARMREENVQ